jgi:dihydrofolate reductase
MPGNGRSKIGLHDEPITKAQGNDGKLTLDISMSLDGFIAGPNQTLGQPLGEGGQRLHEWALAVASFRRLHGLPDGQTDVDDDVVAEALGNTGATVMGRRMFSGGAGPWAGGPNPDAWWGMSRRPSTTRCSFLPTARGSR